jgi:hypothetical protein
LFRTFLGRLLLILQQSIAELHFELILNQKKQFVNMAECSLIALLLIETSAGGQSRRSRSPTGRHAPRSKTCCCATASRRHIASAP